MEMMKLKNGSEVAKPIMITVMMALNTLLQKMPMVAFEAVEMARNPNHQPFGETGEMLEKFGLLLNGQMHGAIRDVIISAAQGEGWDVTIGSPVAT